MQTKKIKLIIVDYYGVLTLGSYKDTCLWLAKKYKMDFDYLYSVIYHKYFSQAALGKITEKQSFELPIKELGLKESWRDLRKKHISFQKNNTPVFNYILKLQKAGFIILLLSTNTPAQFSEALKKIGTKKYFKNIINTFNLKSTKASTKTIKYFLKKFKIRPSEAIMIDDQDFNLVGANKLGVNTIYYKNFKQFKKELDSYLKV